MAHPHNELREHKVQRSRLHRLGFAHGGGIDEHAARHNDGELDKSLKRESAKEGAQSQRAHGGKVKHRMDKRARGGALKGRPVERDAQREIKKITPGHPTPQMKSRPNGGGSKKISPGHPTPQMRAAGGRTKHHKGHGKGKGHTTVNVIVPHGGGPGGPMMAPAPAAVPMRPPVPAAPMGAGALPPSVPMSPPVGMPGAAGPVPGRPMVPIRGDGGRTYKKGGAVSGATWKEGVRAGTQVSHQPGKNDQKDIRNFPPVTYKTGGKVEHPTKGGMAPYPGGGSGLGRLRKEELAEKHYARAVLFGGGRVTAK